jgi:hypothetical protein
MKSAIMSAFLMFSTITVAGDRVSNEMPDWMAGCWEQRKGDEWTEECWTTPKAGIMLGSSRSGKGEKLFAWEAMQIMLNQNSGDGPVVRMALTAAPSGTNPTIFGWRPNEGKGVSFYNLAHDYPQRIRYWREGKDLIAQISLADGTKPVEFRYKKMGSR